MVNNKVAPRDGAARSLNGVVIQRLEQMLRDEGLTEGDAIPPTGELASRFNVSRTVIREALAELAGRGLLKRQQGREGTVALPGGEHLQRVLRWRVGAEQISFDDLQEFREVLEVGSARMAARNATGADIARVSDLLHEMRNASDDEAMLEVDVSFHRAVAYAANPVFGLVLDGLSPLLMESRRQVWVDYLARGGALDVAVARHAALRDRIADRDEDGAAEAMRDDLDDNRRDRARR